MKSDDGVIKETAKQSLSRDMYNAYVVRQGQRSLIRMFLQQLMT